MHSKLSTAFRILQKEGLIALVKKTHQYYFCNSSRRPPKLHLQLLQNKENIVAAEIGVWEGANAERLMNQLDIDELFLIDPYDAYDEYPERKSKPNKMSAAQEKAHKRLDKYSNVRWIEKYSTEAIEEIDRELDYVFVDGNHHYEYVKSDIESYYPLLTEGGIIAGDDANWIGVAQAVTEFAVENEVQPHFERADSDWFFVKGRPIDTTDPLPHSVESNEVTKEKHSI